MHSTWEVMTQMEKDRRERREDNETNGNSGIKKIYRNNTTGSEKEGGNHYSAST